jgi:GntR family transcriptional regulator/MocR family aminotransferase
MAEFIESGAFSRHIRRMRTLYAARQAVLVEASARELRGALDVRPAEAGMHLAAPLVSGLPDVKASRLCDAAGIEAAPASRYAIEARLAPALLLGYAAYDEGTINDSVRRMAKALGR